MPEQQGENRLIEFIGGERDGAVKIIHHMGIEVRVMDWIEGDPEYLKESLYREEPPGSGKFHLKEEKIVKED